MPEPENSSLQTQTKPTRSKRRWVFWVVQLIIALGLLYFVISRLSVDDIVALMQTVAWPWMLLGFLGYLIQPVLRSLHVQRLLLKRVPIRILSPFLMLRVFVGSMIPGGGDTFFVMMAKQRLGVSYKEGVSGMLQVRFWTWMATVIWGGITAIFLKGFPWFVWVVLGLCIFPLGYGTVIVLLNHSEKILPVVGRVKWLARYEERITDWFQKYKEVQRNSFGSRRFIAGVGLLYFLAYIFSLLTQWAVYRTLGLRLVIWEVAAITMTISAVSSLPIRVFGGLGITSASVYYMLILLGLASEPDAAAYGIAYHLVFYLYMFVRTLGAWAAFMLQTKKGPSSESQEVISP